MNRFKASPAIVTIAALAVAVVLTSPASAQSEADLRKQNQELAARVRDLEAELAAAQRQNDALQRRIAQLESQGRPASGAAAPSSSAPPPLPAEQVTVDETKPAASPRALFNALVESYKQAIGESPIGKANDRDRVAYMRKLDRWEPAAEREFKTPVEWHVRALPARIIDTRREIIATFMAVDPVSDVPLGDPFDVALTRPMASRLAELESRGELGVLVMKGTLVTNVRIDPRRETRGSFDNPRFIGPFAEFEFTIVPSSIVPAKVDEVTQPGTTRPGGGGTTPGK